MGCVYGARFSEDGEFYRGVVTDEGEDGKVTFVFMDHGNKEEKRSEDLLTIPSEIAQPPAAALAVEIASNEGVEDSQANRDQVEEILTGEQVTVTAEGRFMVDGEVVMFSKLQVCL